jgi:hypothetical protein
MPRPRMRTEMRPSTPARNRWACLKGWVFSYASRSALLPPPRCGMDSILTPLSPLPNHGHEFGRDGDLDVLAAGQGHARLGLAPRRRLLQVPGP